MNLAEQRHYEPFNPDDAEEERKNFLSVLAAFRLYRYGHRFFFSSPSLSPSLSLSISVTVGMRVRTFVRMFTRSSSKLIEFMAVFLAR